MKPILIVASPYYKELSEMLISGATAAIYAAGYEAEMLPVPGALEIPAAIAQAHQSDRYSAYVALGCVLRGETTHYEIVSNESARGLMDLSTHKLAAIGNGILTCETMAQAIERADPKQGNKGGEAAQAALRLLQIRQVFGLEHS